MPAKLPDIKNENTILDYEKREAKRDKLISMTIMSSFTVLAIQYLILCVFDIAESSLGTQIQLLSKAIVGMFFLVSFPIVMRRNWMIFFASYSISIFTLLYNVLVFPQNMAALSDIIFPFFFVCLPCFVYSYSINNKQVLMNIIYKASDIVFIVGLLIGVMALTSSVSIGAYSLTLSYYMLLPAIVSVYRFFVNKSLFIVIKFIVSFAVILALGSRGAVMCLGVYCILAFIRENSKLTFKTLFFYSSSAICLFVGIIYFKSIVGFAYNFLVGFGIRSRTLFLLVYDGLYLSGRDNLYEVVIEQIVKNPIIGIGVAGDRAFIGGYSHNIFIEILSGFGVFLGGIIISILLLICYKSLTNIDKYDSDISMVWFCIGFLPLLVSGTYLTDFTFWIFLGLVLRILIDKKKLKHKLPSI